MKKLLFIFVFFFVISVLQAQKMKSTAEQLNNIFYLGLFSEGQVLSISYDHLFHKPKKNFSHIIGLQYGYYEEIDLVPQLDLDIFGTGSSSGSSYSRTRAHKIYYTLNAHYLLDFGKKRSKLEMGLGGGSRGSDFFMYQVVGYRLMPLKTANFSLKLSVNIPLFGMNFFPPVGLNVGFGF